jgi:hypothetical protein
MIKRVFMFLYMNFSLEYYLEKSYVVQLISQAKREM